ncbi:hypothetical protein [Winogradskyella sp. PG-2]|uniref:hypothetical protein n=1 Tax=Winogradskyella sp. PG-2 TaxID=754409 RepID=UPI000458927F|nr:hypothetical protein [Winogradskyella sp. PG-2]BAO74804.1 hypothetical protein WPG_0574 [Winogradskyella sp. PG-2]
MSATIFMILRLILGILSLVFGINKFADFLPIPETTGDAANYFSALTSAKTMELVGITLILAGLSLIFNKYSALMTVMLMSISINAFLFHAVLDPSGIARTALFLLLNITLLIGYKDKYKVLLN